MASKNYTYTEERDYLIESIKGFDYKKADEDEIQKYVHALDSLGDKYKEDAKADPIYHTLYLKFLTRNFTDYKKISEFFNSSHLSALYEVHEMDLTPKFNTSNLTLKEFDELRKQYVTTYITKVRKKKKTIKGLIISGSIVASLLVLFLVLTFAAPGSLPFYRHKIKYEVDGKIYETNVVYNNTYVVDYPKKVGYKFLGLFNSEADNAKQVVDSNGKSLGKYSNMFGDTTLYARYEIKTFTITIDNSEKDVVVEGFKTQSVKYMDPIGDLTFEEGGSVSRIGYGLASYSGNGENTIAGTNGVISDDFRILNEQNYNIPLENDDTTIKIIPKWKGNVYTVTFDVNGGNPLEEGKQTQDVVYGSEANLVVPTKEGYGFTGWFLEEGGKLPKQISDPSGKVEEWNIPNNVTLKAEWQVGVYTITFENCNPIAPKTYTYQDPIEIPTPIRYKYDINPRWKDQDGNVYEVGQSYSMPGKDLVLTAQWDSQGWVYITNANEFKEELNKNMSGKYCVVNDISFANMDWEPIGGSKGLSTFDGELDGNEKTISNFKRTSPINPSSNKIFYYGLFGRLGTNSRIHDLNIDNVKIQPSGRLNDDYRYLGILGGESYGQVENVKITNSTIDFCFYAGGKNMLGGLFAMTFNAKIKNCEISANIYSENQNVYGGGIVGYSHGGSIENCKFSGHIQLIGGGGWVWDDGDVCVSGITAVTQNSNQVYIDENCMNSGRLETNKHSGATAYYPKIEDRTWCLSVDW